MEIYTRVFCAAERAPLVLEIIDGVAQLDAQLAPTEREAVLDAEDWTHIELTSGGNGGSLKLWCFRKDGSGAEHFRRETEWYLARVEEQPAGEARTAVLEHLRRSAVLIKTGMTIEDLDDPVFDDNSAVLLFTADNFGGIIQADGEGFYNEEDELLLELSTWYEDDDGGE